MPKYEYYEDVPFYRKQLFFWLMYLICQPAALVLLATGDIYYSRQGILMSFGWLNRVAAVFLLFWWSLLVATVLRFAIDSGSMSGDNDNVERAIRRTHEIIRTDDNDASSSVRMNKDAFKTSRPGGEVSHERESELIEVMRVLDAKGDVKSTYDPKK